MAKAIVKDMLANAVHIGNKKNLWSPKMEEFLHGTQNGVHVFDLYKTADLLEAMKKELEALAKAGKEIIFVGTKIQAQDAIRDLATSTGHHYVITKWVPGLLTNFSTIKRRIVAYNRLKKDLERGALDTLGKKEKAMKVREIERLEKAYIGLKDLRRLPDAVFVLDGFNEKNALEEAGKINMTTFAIFGTTGDPDKATHFVPANCNSLKSIRFILEQLKPCVKRAATRTTTKTSKTSSADKRAKLEGKPAPKTEEKVEAKKEEAPKVEKKAPAKKTPAKKKETAKKPAAKKTTKKEEK